MNMSDDAGHKGLGAINMSDDAGHKGLGAINMSEMTRDIKG